MEWYYAAGQERRGPFDEETFNSYVANGTITDATLVWNKTMKDWVRYGDISSGNSMQTSVGSAQTAEKKICSECGRAYPPDELVSYGKSLICSACKPTFLQKLREGVTASENMEYAGFWIRFGAKVIDILILGAFNMFLGFIYSAFFMSAMVDPSTVDPENIQKLMIPSIIMSLLQWAFAMFYPTWFVGKYGATPGKMVCKLKVVTPENEQVSYWRAFGRYWGEILSGLIFCIGYIMAGFDSEKRALHDRICSTRVIRSDD